MCLRKRERTYLFLPFGTALVRQPHYAGGRCADGDHLQDARSQGCEDDAAVCESDPKKAHPSFHLSQRCFLSFARLLKIVLKNIINKIITWIDVNNTK